MFTRKIQVSLSINQVSFADESNSISVRPVLFINAADPSRILAVGDLPPDADAIAVSLFDATVYEYDKFLFLEAFLRFGIHRLIGRSFRSPVVTFNVTPEIASIFGGFHRFILSEAARRAGAISTVYEAEPR